MKLPSSVILTVLLLIPELAYAVPCPWDDGRVRDIDVKRHQLVVNGREFDIEDHLHDFKKVLEACDLEELQVHASNWDQREHRKALADGLAEAIPRRPAMLKERQQRTQRLMGTGTATCADFMHEDTSDALREEAVSALLGGRGEAEGVSPSALVEPIKKFCWVNFSTAEIQPTLEVAFTNGVAAERRRQKERDRRSRRPSKGPSIEARLVVAMIEGLTPPSTGTTASSSAYLSDGTYSVERESPGIIRTDQTVYEIRCGGTDRQFSITCYNQNRTDSLRGTCIVTGGLGSRHESLQDAAGWACR